MNKIKLLLLLNCSLITSCVSQNISQKIQPFPENKSIYAEKIKVNEIIAIDGIDVKKGNVFVTDSRNKNAMLYQYSPPEFKCIYKGGIMGGGENEFQTPPSICKNTSDIIYVRGYTPFLIKGFMLDTTNHLSLEKEFRIPFADGIANFMNVVNDSILIYSMFPNKLDIEKINLNSQQKTGQILIEQSQKEIFFDMNRGYLAANDSLIIYAYTYKKQIDFYRVSDMSLCKRLIDSSITPNVVVGNIKETKFIQRELVAGKNYFYIRCPKKGGGCFIEVFDYLGHSIAKYELDILLYAFGVDERNRIIYGYNSDIFEDGLLKYAY